MRGHHVGDREAVQQEYRDYAAARTRQLFRIAYLLCGDWHEAEDLVQITLAKLFVAWHQVRRRDSVDTYARRVTLGRGLRRRRRRRIALGNTVLLGAVAGVAVAVGTHQPRQPAPAGLTGTVGSPTASAIASVAPSTPTASTYSLQITVSPSGTQTATAGLTTPAAPSTTATATLPAPAAAMLHQLEALLPAGSAVSNVRVLNTRSLEVDYDDGHGPVDLMLAIMPTQSLRGITCPNPLWPNEGPRPAGALPESCAMRTPPAGGQERDAVMYADAYGFYGYNVYDERPGGYTVFVQVGNGTLGGLPKVTRADPPGTMAQWESLAENPAWVL
jgi:DNA-directed RNA polymerase specialized sigma24 family protein